MFKLSFVYVIENIFAGDWLDFKALLQKPKKCWLILKKDQDQIKPASCLMENYMTSTLKFEANFQGVTLMKPKQ